MFSKLGQLEIHCDAPPYAVVQACEQVGYRTPLDVRWCRITNFLQEYSVLGTHLWKLFFGKTDSTEKTCTCGQPLPMLENYAFTLGSGAVINFFLGQCCRCRTMFWEQGGSHSR